MKFNTLFSLVLTLLLTLLSTSRSEAQGNEQAPDLISITGAFDLGMISASSGTGLGLVGLDGDVRYYAHGRHGVALRFTQGMYSISLAEARYSLRFGSNPRPNRHISVSGSFDIGAGAGTLEKTDADGFFFGGARQTIRETHIPIFGVLAATGSVHFSGFDLALEFGARIGGSVVASRTGPDGPRLLGDSFWAPYAALRVGSTFNL